MSTIASGPAFEPDRHGTMKKVRHIHGGAHYSVFHMDCGPADREDPEGAMRTLRGMFPKGEANPENFVLFSTSGVHGTYITIEDIEACLTKYGDDFVPAEGEEPDGWCDNTLTVLVVQPRIVCMRCGNVRVRLADISWLKKLRASSLKAVAEIGMPD